MASLIGRVSSASSIGTIHFVRVAGGEGLERLEVLERHRLVVDPLRRAEDRLQRVAEALGAQDLRLALALGAEDVALLVALGDVDRGLARALRLGDMARRLRSALIWRFIASWMSRGGTISRISTLVIFTPQRSVTSSSFARRMWLISSRLASTSSSGMSPMTARSVVAASAWRRR